MLVLLSGETVTTNQSADGAIRWSASTVGLTKIEMW